MGWREYRVSVVRKLGLCALLVLVGTALAMPTGAAGQGGAGARGGGGGVKTSRGGGGVRVHRGAKSRYRHKFGKRRKRLVTGFAIGSRCRYKRLYYVRTVGNLPCRLYAPAYGYYGDAEPLPLWVYKQPGQARPWSWRNFRRKAGWEQKYWLWQTHIYKDPIYGPGWAW